MDKMKTLKTWCDSKGNFIDGVTCTKAEEALELKMFNYQGDWFIRPTDIANNDFCYQENIEDRVLPLFEEILKFENPSIVYTLLFVSNKIHKLQYSKHYHLDNDIDFDIFIVSSILEKKQVEGLIPLQLNLMPEIDSLETLAHALLNLPYNFKGIVIYNKMKNSRMTFLNENFLSIKNVIDKNEIKTSYYDLFKRGELNNFLVDYEAFKNDADEFINSEIKPCINWLQLAFERKLDLTSDNEKLQKIYDSQSISQFLKYDFKDVSFNEFKILQEEILSYSVNNETFK